MEELPELGKRVSFTWDRMALEGDVIRVSADGKRVLVRFDIPGPHRSQTRKMFRPDELKEVTR